MVPPAVLTAVWDRARTGDLLKALDQLIALRDRAGVRRPLEQAALLGALIECRLAQGDLAEAVLVGKSLTPLLALDGLVGALAHHAKGELATAMGDPELAAMHFTHAGEIAPDAPADQLPWRSGAALAHLRSGDRRRAADLAREQVDLTRAAGSPYAVASALRTLATVEAGPDRFRHLLRARDVLAGTESERLAAEIDTDLAGLLLLEHEAEATARAQALLRSAEEVAGRQELWPLQARVRRLLQLLGEQPRRVRAEAIAVLTSRERRVARLAVDGLTNRQIGEQLSISIKAVEWHLTHVYRKLAITSRADLASTLGAAL